MVNKPDPVLDSPAFIAKVNERYDALVERGKVPPRANKCADRGPDPDKQDFGGGSAAQIAKRVAADTPASAKKSWAKPVLKRYVRVPLDMDVRQPCLTESNKPVVLESNRGKKSNRKSTKESNSDLLESNKPNKGFDKKVYQRDLMRKRRATCSPK